MKTGRARATVTVQAVVATRTGTGHRLILRDAHSRLLKKAQFGARFGSSAREKFTMPIAFAETEEELDQLLARASVVRVQIGRIPLPRIVFNENMYWPPSQRVFYDIAQQTYEIARQGIWGAGALSYLPLAAVEGTDLSAVWEPIWAQHPAATNPDWPWPERRRRGRKTVRLLNRQPAEKAQ